MILLDEILRVILYIWEALFHIWPLLLVTIPLAVTIKTMDISKYIHSLFSKNIGFSIMLATLVGAISPFCSCGIIPIISALLMAGVPIAPVMSFWLASPSMDPEIFFLSVGSLGLPLAVTRIIATFIMSLSGGIFVHLLYGKEPVENFLITKPIKTLHVLPSVSITDPTEGGLESFEFVTNKCECPPDYHTKLKLIFKNTVSSAFFVLKFLVLAYFIEALIIFYLPSSIMQIILNLPGVFSVMAAAGIAVPLYTTNISALGLVSGLLTKGLSGGAGLSFLIGGATTTIPAMAAVYKIVDKRIFRVYLGTAIFFSIFSGLLFSFSKFN